MSQTLDAYKCSRLSCLSLEERVAAYDAERERQVEKFVHLVRKHFIERSNFTLFKQLIYSLLS